MKLTTERLELRFFNIDDAQDVARICNNINIYNNTLFLPYPYTYEDAVSWIEYLDESFDLDRFFTFAITDKKTGDLYGCIGIIMSQVHKHAEIGYWLGEDYWNRGIMSEALESVIEHLFKERKLHRIYASHFKFNPASGRVMEKVGMSLEGVSKGHILKNGVYLDLVNYSIINDK